MIMLSVIDDNIAKKFCKYHNIKELQNVLKNKFRGVYTTKLYYVSIKFDAYKKRNAFTIKRHFRETAKMIEELSDARYKLTEDQKVQAMIHFLAQGWSKRNATLIMPKILRPLMMQFIILG